MYQAIYDDWRENPLEFWMRQGDRVDWIKPPKTAFDNSSGLDRWYPDGVLNTCHNCVDRHVADGRGDQPALIYDSPITGTKSTITYSELLDRVELVAGFMQKLGAGKGDRVIIYMPMIPETAVAALACARIGAVHSIVFGGFAPAELATRIDDAEPALIMTASCGIEPGRVIAYKPLLDGAIDLAVHKPQACVVFQREAEKAPLIDGRDYDWAELEAGARANDLRADCVPVMATDPLYILYTSGTTGVPKGVVRDNGGHLVSLLWSMENIYDIDPGEVFWSASDLGWVVGHSFILYGPLATGATSILYEGKPVGTPDAGAFWRVISEHGVKALFTAPTAFRAIKKEDHDGRLLHHYDLSCLKALFLAGERVDPDTIDWAECQLGVPVVDNWWQTETGWPICSNPVGAELLPIKKGSPSVAMPGYKIEILDDDQNIMGPGKFGTIVIKLPLPPGCLPTLWHNDDGFQKSYLVDFPGYYNTGDAGYLDEDGYLFVMARTDDIINVAGHRLSTGGMEAVLSSHPDVAECAVLGVHDALKGELPLGLVVLNDGVEKPEQEVLSECVQRVREEIGPVAAFKLVTAVKRLPKTRSGKVLRGTVRNIANGETWKMPATIDDPEVLNEITADLQNLGYPQSR